MRIAQRMGLHTDGSYLKLRPFEAEMRRRLWWQILMLDQRVIQVSGAPSSLTSYFWNTNIPSNLNDNDLLAGMRDTPVESERPTETLFVLIQCEICNFKRKLQAAADSSTDSQTKTIDFFEEHLQRKYLKHCDPSVPLHLVSNLMLQLELSKLRFGVFRPQALQGSRPAITQTEQDAVFCTTLKVMEFHNAMLAAADLQKFVWYSFTNPPFQAYLQLLCGLRTRTSGELADRAWNQLAAHAENRERHDTWDKSKKSGPLHLAIANLTVKAWEVRETARPLFMPALPVPRFVSLLRSQLLAEKPRITDNGRGAGASEMTMSLNSSLTNPNLGMGAFTWPDFTLTGESIAEWLTYDDLIQGGDSNVHIENS